VAGERALGETGWRIRGQSVESEVRGNMLGCGHRSRLGDRSSGGGYLR
jgi:hypothetical protein